MIPAAFKSKTVADINALAEWKRPICVFLFFAGESERLREASRTGL